jgi:hypothetical protein
VRDPFIYTSDDVLRMLDVLVEGTGWDEFYADRAKPCPFFVQWPGENLAEWFGEGLLAPGCSEERLRTLWDAAHSAGRRGSGDPAGPGPRVAWINGQCPVQGVCLGDRDR